MLFISVFAVVLKITLILFILEASCDDSVHDFKFLRSRSRSARRKRAKTRTEGTKTYLATNESTLSIISSPLPPPPPSNKSCLLIDPVSGHQRQHHILLFVDSKFAQIFSNWLAHFRDACGDARLNQLDVVCMDEDVQAEVLTLGLRCSPHSFFLEKKTSLHMKQAAVWLKRLEIIIFYLQHETDLLLSDTDAIWRRDPYFDISRYAVDNDIVASRGSFPRSLTSLWGATLCMGFIYIKSSPFTISLMQTVLEDMKLKEPIMYELQALIALRNNLTSPSEELLTNITKLSKLEGNKPDDQYSINYVLHQWGIRWPADMEYTLNSRVDIGTVTRNGSKHGIALLSHEQYVRNCTRTNQEKGIRRYETARRTSAEATVAHCIAAPGNAFKKYSFLKSIHLWHIEVPKVQMTSWDKKDLSKRKIVKK